MSKEYTITLEKAQEVYSKSPAWLKKSFQENFGKAAFEKKKVENRLPTSYEEACKRIHIKPLKASQFNHLPEWQRASAFSRHKLEIITYVVNDGHVFNYDSNNNEYKWFPCFDMRGSGFVFSRSGYGYHDVCAAVGSALVFRTEKDSDYVATTFLNDWRNIMKQSITKTSAKKVTKKAVRRMSIKSKK